MSFWFNARAALPGVRGAIVHVLHADCEALVLEVLEDAGFDVRVVEGAAIVDDQSFFEQLPRLLRLRPYPQVNWDAFNDSLCDLGGRVAWIWRDADRTFEQDAQVLINAALGLADAGLEPMLESREPPLMLQVFLLGRGPGFKGLSTRLVES